MGQIFLKLAWILQAVYLAAAGAVLVFQQKILLFYYPENSDLLGAGPLYPPVEIASVLALSVVLLLFGIFLQRGADGGSTLCETLFLVFAGIRIFASHWIGAFGAIAENFFYSSLGSVSVAYAAALRNVFSWTEIFGGGALFCLTVYAALSYGRKKTIVSFRCGMDHTP